MAFDGIVIANLTKTLSEKLTGGRIVKIHQPEKEELVLTIKTSETFRLFMSVSGAMPLVYLTETTRDNPLTAPNFCMLLRKYLNSARIISITQPDLERVIDIRIEHLNELGDLCVKHLILELMGKHSNIILTDDEKEIVDSIKHVSSLMSSVREVLPGRPWFLVKQGDRKDPRNETLEGITEKLSSSEDPEKLLISAYNGISPLIAGELIFRAGSTKSDTFIPSLAAAFVSLFKDVSEGRFIPGIVYKNDEPVEYSSVKITSLDGEFRPADDICFLLESYYDKKNRLNLMRQKSQDLRRITLNAIERAQKKLALQKKQLEDTKKRDRCKLFGDLLSTYGYGIEDGAATLTANDFYTGEAVVIPLDPTLSAQENAAKYYDRYRKLKRTFDALSVQIVESQDEVTHLESVRASLDIADCDADLNEIRRELAEFGYMKRAHIYSKQAHPGKQQKNKTKPFHYISSDGFDLFVGKNNYQNDELTFKFAAGNDWWFHAKGVPGSHVILKTTGEEIPDRAFEEAAGLAAYYSDRRQSDKVEIDYLEKKGVKKPSGGKPGFVIYHSNYSMMASPDISSLKSCN